MDTSDNAWPVIPQCIEAVSGAPPGRAAFLPNRSAPDQTLAQLHAPTKSQDKKIQLERDEG